MMLDDCLESAKQSKGHYWSLDPKKAMSYVIEPDQFPKWLPGFTSGDLYCVICAL